MPILLQKGFYRKSEFLNNVDASLELNISHGTSLMTLVKNDLLYGVGSRPSLPSCFDDEEDLNKNAVDPMADLRHDSWHDASVAMNPTFQRTEQTIEVGSQAETTSVDDTSKDE